MSGNQKKSDFMIQMENEARAKEILERDQIFELNKAMYDGQDLNQAAQNIFGSGSNSGSGSGGFRVKSANGMNYQSHNYH